ncbi:hypothetical protein ACFYU8_06740 [Brevibacillus sp. NPDC003359]|uniref:hypothetical protein n=1 Tax=unclassified Brevibacillus TaxID=2684853 RepID=UPI0036B7ED82
MKELIILFSVFSLLNNADDYEGKVNQATYTDIKVEQELAIGYLDKDEAVKNAISNYLINVNSPKEFSKYSTDAFIDYLYYACLGDQGAKNKQQKVEELDKYYSEEILHITESKIIAIKVISNSEITVKVQRKWEDSSVGKATYVLKKIGADWKFDSVTKHHLE